VKAQEILDQARDVMTVNRVFGTPYEKDGITLFPTANIWGGAGGGSGEGQDGRGAGSGSGFGLREKPAGAFVIKEGQVRWIPSLDVNRIILGGQLVAMVALLVSVLRHRRKHQAPV
jgi:uncharacterized spore protein YtfJ